MATAIWRGDALPVAQVITIDWTAVPADTESTTLSINGKDITLTRVTATHADLVAYATAFAALIGDYDSTIPEWAEASAELGNTDQVVITGPIDGTPISVSGSCTDGSVTLTITTATAATGPHHANNADNWSTGSVPGGIWWSGFA